MFGDCFETLLWVRREGHKLAQELATLVSADAILVHEVAGEQLVEVKAGEFVSEQAIAKLNGAFAIRAVKRLSPVLPVLSLKATRVPFTTCAEMLRHDQGRNTALWKLAVEYERARGGLTEAEVIAKMVDIVRILRRSIAQGIAGTSYDDRVLGHQCGRFNDLMKWAQIAANRKAIPGYPQSQVPTTTA
jgi:L-serine dehydratase